MGLLLQSKEIQRLSVRLAESSSDLDAVQRLRWQVFRGETAGSPGTACLTELDADSYDALCDHLLVVDEGLEAGQKVVGTYRLLRESVARRSLGFYSASEFDLSPLTIGAKRPDGELLELGRSCVLPPYRTSRTISLLWRGIASYIEQHHIGLMFGCASFTGVDPEHHAPALSWLHDHYLADTHQRPRALYRSDESWRLLPHAYDAQKAKQSLPPLIKGYLRCGAKVGEGIFIDRDFNTVDVCIVMPVDKITGRYAARFSGAA